MLRPGELFRQYQLLEQIGVGGQAVVWSAVDPGRKRICAIKFNKVLDSDEISPEEIGIEQKMERLVALQHPHILPLHEYGTEQRVRFMVSPYIPGGTLAARLKARTLTVEQILQFGMEIASALDYLHSQGVIHRDLKATNILMDLSQHTYLADFGLARLVSTSTLAFHTGHGTPPYAPPEQVRSKELTRKSDIFSFGILLYEMFTGQLPWNGSKQLGVEQLHSSEQLPDLRQQVPELPPLLTDVLRRVTSADPDLRPRSASEVMQMVCYVFKVSSESWKPQNDYDEEQARLRDAGLIAKGALSQWQSGDGAFHLGLTQFALLDLQRERLHGEGLDRLMLSQALTYGYNDEHWWSAVNRPSDRLSVSSALLARGNEVIAERILAQLLGGQSLTGATPDLPENVANALLAVGAKTGDADLRQKIFAGLRRLLSRAHNWHERQMPSEHIKRLGQLALEDSAAGDTTAELIGHLRLSSAVKAILRHADENRKVEALLLVQEAAGGLPSFVPRQMRSRLSLSWILHRLTLQPANLVAAYFTAFLGAALGVGSHVYLTYNLPTFLDIARVNSSIVQGLIVGAILGLGVFLTRVIVERFQTSSVLPRLLLGTLAGGVVINIAFLVFHVLFLNTLPAGVQITLGSIGIALAFALSGLLPARLLKMILSISLIFLVVMGTWWIHIRFATSALELVPLLRYDYTWSLARVALTALSVCLLMGSLGNLVRLSARDGYR